jgi:hypothetical protein
MNSTMTLRQADRQVASLSRDTRLVFQLLEKIAAGSSGNSSARWLQSPVWRGRARRQHARA